MCEVYSGEAVCCEPHVLLALILYKMVVADADVREDALHMLHVLSTRSLNRQELGMGEAEGRGGEGGGQGGKGGGGGEAGAALPQHTPFDSQYLPLISTHQQAPAIPHAPERPFNRPTNICLACPPCPHPTHIHTLTGPHSLDPPPHARAHTCTYTHSHTRTHAHTHTLSHTHTHTGPRYPS